MELPVSRVSTAGGSSQVARLITTDNVAHGQAPKLAKSTKKKPSHRKTRTGCFHCKRRRIKCKEERPACRNCIKSGYTCEYSMPVRLYLAPDQVPRFTMLDMHFFQHFLLQCRPVYPLGNEQVWKHDVLCLSHNHEFLLYAVLGFAAADLEASGGTNSSLSLPAMTYRYKAIQLFRKAITAFQGNSEKPASKTAVMECRNPQPRKSANIAGPGDPKPQADSKYYGKSIMSFDQGSALVAACYLLMGQSQYLGDGVQDFMTLTRGSMSLRAEMLRLGFPPLFQNLEPVDSVETMRRYLLGVPPLDELWIAAGEKSLEKLTLVCREDLQLTYVKKLQDILINSRVDTFKVYQSIMNHFLWWGGLPFDEFQRIIDMTDQVNILLATHWVSLMMVMSFLKRASTRVNDDSKKQAEGERHGIKTAIAEAKEKGQCTEPWFYWLVCMNGWVTDDYLKFNTWPQWVQERLEENAQYF